MKFIDEDISNYAEHMSSPAPAYLTELERASNLRTTKGRMVSGFLQGRLLASLSKMNRPELILDIGTFTGYSALCLAEGLSETGRLITLEQNEELSVIQNEFFEKSPYRSQIEQVFGDALTYLKNCALRPNLIFLDADKSTYVEFWNEIKEIMPQDGVLIADNVLWYGKVLMDKDENDPSTEIVKTFNQLVKDDERFDVSMLPIRDGLTLIIKK